MKKYLVLLLMVVLLMPAAAQDNLSLGRAIQLGLGENYDIQLVKISEKSAAVNNSWGAAGALPSLALKIADAESRYDYNDSEVTETSTVVPSIDLNWILFDGFKMHIRKDQLELLEDQSAGNSTVLIESTIQQIILAYYGSLLENERLKTTEELMELSRDRYAAAQEARKLGSSSSYELLQSQNAWLEDRATYLAQEAVYHNSLRDLNYLLGIEDDQEFYLTEKFEFSPTDYMLADLQRKMLKNNASLKITYLGQQLQELETKQARRDYLPTVALNAGVQETNYTQRYDGQADVDSDSRNAYANLSLSLDLFNGGSRLRATQIAKLNAEAAEVQTRQMEHSLRNQLRQLYETYQVRRELFSLAEEQEAAAKMNLDMSKEKLQSGAINSFNYRDIQLMYLNAANNRLNATYNLLQSETALLKITGGIIGVN